MRHINKKQSFNKITGMMLPVAIAIGLLAFLFINFYLNNQQYSELDSSIKEIVEVHMMEAMGGYVGEGAYGKPANATGVNTITRKTSTVAVALSAEDQNTIIESVLGVLEPKLYGKINSLSEVVQEKAVMELEEKLRETIEKTVEDKLTETVFFDEKEKTLLSNSIITIVEKDILAKLEENEEKSKAAIEVLRKNIELNIKGIEDVLKKYEEKLTTMNTDIKNLQTQVKNINVGNTVSSESLKKQLDALQNSYNEFQIRYAINLANTVQISSIVTNATDPVADSDAKILSGSAGYDLAKSLEKLRNDSEKNLQELNISINQGIATQIQDINKNIAGVDAKVDETKNQLSNDMNNIQGELKNNLTELESKTASKEELEREKQALEQALGDVESALKVQSKDDIEAAKQSLETAINTMGDNASKELQDAKNALENAMNQQQNNLSGELNGVKTALEGNISNIEVNITNLEEEISGLNNQITSINQRIQQMQDAQVTYQWNSEGVIITVP